MEAVPLKKANELAATNPSHKTPISKHFLIKVKRLLQLSPVPVSYFSSLHPLSAVDEDKQAI